MTPLDAAAPFVLSTKPLRRRAGAMSTVRRTVPAPDGWSVATCSVPRSSPVDLDLRLESVVEGVLVTGAATIQERAECSRCLDPVDRTATIDLQQLYVYDDAARQDQDPDEPLPVLEGELLDLEPTLRDAVVLELPLAPLCRADCPGLCPECGLRLADDPAHRHQQVDARWAALTEWAGVEPTRTSDPYDAREGQ